jgi:hypothetical protein
MHSVCACSTVLLFLFCFCVGFLFARNANAVDPQCSVHSCMRRQVPADQRVDQSHYNRASRVAGAAAQRVAVRGGQLPMSPKKQ